MSEVVRMTAEGLLVPRAALSDLADDSGFVLRRDGRNLVLVPAEPEEAAAVAFGRLLDAFAKVRADAPLSPDEIQAEIDAYRREQSDAEHRH